MTTKPFGDLVGSIDEGTTSARFVLFKAGTAEVVCFHQKEIQTFTPSEGWVEQDPIEILDAVNECIEKTVEKLITLGGTTNDIVAVGVTNQRESTIVWDRKTGKPLHNSIVWMDVRTSSTVDELTLKAANKEKDFFQKLCGLPLSTYFSGVKLRWLKDNVLEIGEAIKNETCQFGTVDSWLLYNLTGGILNGIHVTDVTNASRTMLMNIKTCKWDLELLDFFEIPKTILPNIKSCSEIYGHFSNGPLKGIPLSGCLGDQQAALVGQQCLEKGQAKATYGTGCFLLYNTGSELVLSNHGLLSTIAYQFGPNAPAVYALEGSVAIAGAAITWLRDNLGVIKDVQELTELLDSVEDCGGIYFVPAFSGLYAPHWNKEARGVIYGLTEDTQKGHIMHATLEAVCFQVRDILGAMTKDCNFDLVQLKVDGGMTANKLMLQKQSDLVGLEVIRPAMAESSALGAAIAAGRAVGKWDERKHISIEQNAVKPKITEEQRDVRYAQWKRAIERSFGWDI